MRERIAIDVNLALSCRVSQRTVVNRGGAIMAVIDAITAPGFVPEIKAVCSQIFQDTCLETPVTAEITIDTRPIDLDAIAFIACNPAATRRVSLAWMEAVCGGDEVCCCNSYGYPTTWKSSGDCRQITFRPLKSDNESDYITIEAARKSAQKAIDAIVGGERCVMA